MLGAMTSPQANLVRLPQAVCSVLTALVLRLHLCECLHAASPHLAVLQELSKQGLQAMR